MKTYPSPAAVEVKSSAVAIPLAQSKFLPFPEVRTDWHAPMRASSFVIFSLENRWQDQVDAALKIIDSGIRKKPAANYPEAA